MYNAKTKFALFAWTIRVLAFVSIEALKYVFLWRANDDEKNFLLVYTFTDFDFIKTEEHFLSNGTREEEGSCLERAPYVFIELFTTLTLSSTSEIEIMCADKTENLPIWLRSWVRKCTRYQYQWFWGKTSVGDASFAGTGTLARIRCLIKTTEVSFQKTQSSFSLQVFVWWPTWFFHW